MIEEVKSKILSIENLDEKIEFINLLRKTIHSVSPFKTNPVDLVLREKQENVTSNDYNPNEVAPPEMELLEVSIINDGYTQPIVGWKREDGVHEIVDGFHRHRVGKESKLISSGLHGYLPLVNIRQEQQSKNDRIASTIRHNRARGKHKVDAMSEIVIELKNRNWTNDRIAKQLGMDDEEVLRLLQVSGLQDMFKDDDFSKAWVSEDSLDVDLVELDDNLDGEFIDSIRVVNVDDPERIFHTYDKRECHKAGFYIPTVEGKTQSQCEKEFAEFFSQKGLFEKVANKVIADWKHSCEQYLSNKCMNRIARIGQASVCYHTGIGKKFSSGRFLLDKETQDKNDSIALNVINKRMVNNGRKEITMEEAKGGDDRQVNIY